MLGHEDAPFPLANPALVSMPPAFAVGVIVSLLKPEREASRRFIEQERQQLLGAPAAGVGGGASPARAR